MANLQITLRGKCHWLNLKVKISSYSTFISQIRHPRHPAPGHSAVGGGPGQDEGPGGRAPGTCPHPTSGGGAGHQVSHNCQLDNSCTQNLSFADIKEKVLLCLISLTDYLQKQNTYRDVLTAYRDAIQFVHDQTVRLMNKGLTGRQCAEVITGLSLVN